MLWRTDNVLQFRKGKYLWGVLQNNKSQPRKFNLFNYFFCYNHSNFDSSNNKLPTSGQVYRLCIKPWQLFTKDLTIAPVSPLPGTQDKNFDLTILNLRSTRYNQQWINKQDSNTYIWVFGRCTNGLSLFEHLPWYRKLQLYPHVLVNKNLWWHLVTLAAWKPSKTCFL